MTYLSRVFLLLRVTEVLSLVCYSCHSDSENSSCVHSPRSIKWELCHGQCQVWRLYSEVDSSTYMFERSCSTLCRDGCTHLSDMEHRFIGCSSCCESDFCNTGNSCSFVNFITAFVVMLLFSRLSF